MCDEDIKSRRPCVRHDNLHVKDAMTTYRWRSHDMFKLGRLCISHGTLWMEWPW